MTVSHIIKRARLREKAIVLCKHIYVYMEEAFVAITDHSFASDTAMDRECAHSTTGERETTKMRATGHFTFAGNDRSSELMGRQALYERTRT